MAIYKYSHNCGINDFLQFLNEDKESMVLKCSGCGRGVIAKQVRDKSIHISQKDGVRGIMRAGNDTNN